MLRRGLFLFWSLTDCRFFVRVFCLTAILSLCHLLLLGQPIPTNLPVFEESLRRGQLLGMVDSSRSFTVRPLYPTAAEKFSDGYRIHEIFPSADSVQGAPLLKTFLKGHGKVLVLPPSFQTQFNSRHPYGWGDGAMIPNRGYQHLMSAGVYGQVGPLRIQLRPEWVYAENKIFEGFSSSLPQEIQDARYHHWVSADPAERFGLSRYSQILPGQSSVALHFGPVRVGAGNENIWWGPGQFNSLTFSNNSRPFENLTLATARPVKTWLGNFEGQLLMGRLQSPDFQPLYGNGFTISKNPDWRYLSAIMFSYNPKWVKGLFMGAARTFQQYNDDFTPSFGSYFPVFQAFQKETVGLAVDDLNQDQQIAVFLRWLFQKANAEVYFEFGRRDHALNWRDFMMSPEHARAFLFGFSKLFQIKKADYIQVRFELTQSQQSINHLLRYSGDGGGQSWGAHIPVLHGFSHYGQQLGNGVGPGNNAQTLEVAWVRDIRKVGVVFERLEHQMDFFNRAFRDGSAARPWVDVSTGLVGHWRFNRLVANARVQFIRSLNYQWQQGVVYAGGESARGVDRFNLHSYMGVTYLF